MTDDNARKEHEQRMRRRRIMKWAGYADKVVYAVGFGTLWYLIVLGLRAVIGTVMRLCT